MSPAAEKTDDELLENLSASTPGALSAIVERYLDTLYDFALRTSLDEDFASTSVVAAFRLIRDAAGRADGLGLKPLLLGLTRHEALDRAPRRGASAGPAAIAISDQLFSQLPLDHPAFADADLAAWAWEAARVQGARDYSLLDLLVRQELTPQEVASATEMSQRGIFAVLGRRRGSLEETFTTSFLFHRGVEACDDLATLVAPHQQPSAALQRDILRHLATCARCENSMRTCPAPAELLAAFVPVGADADTKVAAFAIDQAEDADATPGEVFDLQPALSAQGLAHDQPGLVPALIQNSAGVPQSPASETDEIEQPVVLAATELAASNAGFPSTSVAAPEAVTEVPADGPSPVQGAATFTGAAREGAVLSSNIEAGQRRPSSPDSAGRGADSFPGDRLPSGGGGSSGNPPPRRPWEGLADWLGENGPARLPLVILLVAAMLLAGYLGLAIGDSLEGGSKTSAAIGLAALPTSQPGVREIACGTGPIDVDQGSPITLSFDADGRIIPGFQITDLNVKAVSAAGDPKSINAKAQQGLTMSLLAQPIAGAPGRTDEYVVNVTFAKSGDKAVSDCSVRVHAPLVAPTVAPTATSVPTLTPSPTVRAAVVQPTSPAPAPTNTSAPTVAPTNTVTATATLTPTRTPTATPTRTPTPVNDY
jgi:hypothetical protein